MNTNKIHFTKLTRLFGGTCTFSLLAIFIWIAAGSELLAQNITQIQPLNGTAGTSVTIYGSGFDASTGANTVSFIPTGGGTATTATVTSASATKLIVTVPAIKGGNYTLSVQRASDNAVSTSPDNFSVSTGGGDFGTVGSTEIVVSTDVNYPTSVFATDVDGDGNLDIVAASRFDDSINWFKNDGNLNFTKKVVSTNADGAFSVHAADVDGDGDMDLMSASNNDDKIAWYENDGAADPSFTEHVVSTNFDDPLDVYAADIDGDGDIDLLSADRNSSRSFWFENDGNQNFTERVVSSSAKYPESVYAADIDGDGDIDLMYAFGREDKIAWYENDGATDPSFTERIVSTDIDYTNDIHDVRAADVDGDGDLDLIGGAGVGGDMALFVNDGAADPSFTRHRVKSSISVNAVSSGDMDGDGDLDIVTAQTRSISWFSNESTTNPYFRSKNVHLVLNLTDIFVADMNNDGTLDIISSISSDDKISVYINNPVTGPLTITQLQKNNGVMGTSLTVYGSGFDVLAINNKVSFTSIEDGTKTTATITAKSATQLTITVPQVSGGNYNISVQRASDGTNATSLEIFSVVNGGGNFGSVGSSENVVSINSDGTSTVYAADVDGDGDLDMISGSTLDDKIAWYENNGSQNFTEHVVSTNADVVESIFAADVDGDGDLDLMSASSGDDKIAWYENDGDQNFTERVVSTNADGANSVFAADVDGDGDLDLISTSYNDDKIAWYINDGATDPSFTERVVSTNADGANSIYASDIDGDGHMDLISTSYNDDKISWYENLDYNTPPTFTEHEIITNAGGPNSIYATDVDGDGDLDLMYASSTKNEITILERRNPTSPSFYKQVVSTNADGANSVYPADVDGDGDIDLMSASSGDDKIAWYENDGDQNFTERVVSTNADGANSIYAADIDGDGDIDLMSASSGDDKIAWYKNISPAPTITQLQPHNGAVGTSVTIYGKGFDDLITDNTVTFTPAGGGTATTATITAANATVLTITVPEITGGNYTLSMQRDGDSDIGTFPPFFAISTGGGDFGAISSSENVVRTNANNAKSVYAADMDGDGDLDLLSASDLNQRPSWYENRGDQRFTERELKGTEGGTNSIYATDIDGDGDMDALAAFAGDDKIAWYENNGATDPSFTPYSVSTNADGARSVYAADVDGDGDMDLMSASYNDDKIAWYENDGAANPSFTERVVSTNADGANSIYAADVDGDGDIDLMSASASDDKIAWYENDGDTDPSFTERIVSTNADFAYSVYAADVDGDGDIDLMSASSSDDKIAWYENDGATDPSFTEHVVSTNVDDGRSVYAADLDADGDIDLMSADLSDDKIVWHKNDGAQNFTEVVVSANADGASSVFAADMDGDGDIDLMSASSNDDKIAWYENKSVLSTGGRSLSFDGNGDFLDIPDDNDLDFTNGFTIEAWVQPSSISGTLQQLVAKEGAYRFGFNNSLLRFSAIGVQDYDLSFSLTAGQWSHLAVVFDAANDATFYVNGANVGTVSGNAPVPVSTNTLKVGQNGADSEFFNGVMDELRFWNIERTSTQIQQSLFQPIAWNENGLVGYFCFNETKGSTTTDATNNSFIGRFNGDVSISDNTHVYGTVITGSEGWRLMSTPVGGASYGELLSDIFTQGFTGADSESGASNVLTYNEVTKSFSSIENATDVPAVGSGFIVYVFEDDDPETGGIQGGFPKTVFTDSSQNEGTATTSLTFTDTTTPLSDGFNLIGNPYGSTIDWDANSGWTRNNLDASFYVWSDSANGGAGAYLSWNGVTGTKEDGKIAPWQGFWVKADTDSPVLTFSDQVRSNGGVFLKKKPASTISLTLAGDNQRSSAILSFQEKASTSKDLYDTYKLQSLNTNYLSLFTQLSDGSGLDINALPLGFEEAQAIPLDFDGSNLSGEFKLRWNPTNLPDEMAITLVDNKTGTEIDLRKAASYSFTLDEKSKATPSGNTISPKHGVLAAKVIKAKNSTSTTRFTINLNSGTSVHTESVLDIPENVELQQNYPNPFNPSTTIAFGLPQNGKVTLEVFDLMGRKVANLINGENKSAGHHSVNFDASGLSSGMYIYRLKTGNTMITKKLTLIK